MVATAEKAKEKPTKWPSETHLAEHTGLNRHDRRLWKHETRGVAFSRRIASPTERRQRLDPKRKANRWLARAKP